MKYQNFVSCENIFHVQYYIFLCLIKFCYDCINFFQKFCLYLTLSLARWYGFWVVIRAQISFLSLVCFNSVSFSASNGGPSYIMILSASFKKSNFSVMFMSVIYSLPHDSWISTKVQISLLSQTGTQMASSSSLFTKRFISVISKSSFSLW